MNTNFASKQFTNTNSYSLNNFKVKPSKFLNPQST